MDYKSFRVKDFRCFEDLQVNDIKRINLISGKNSVGKTALLEALFIHSGGYNPNLIMTVDGLRGISSVKFELGWWADTPWDFVFRNFDSSRRIELSGDYGSGIHRTVKVRIIRKPEEIREIWPRIRIPAGEAQERDISSPVSTEAAQVLEVECEDEKGVKTRSHMVVEPGGARIELVPPPPYPGYFQGARGRLSPHDIADRFSKIEVKKKTGSLLEALRIVEPGLKGVSLAFSGSVPILYGSKEGLDRLIPLNLMGDGITRIAELYLGIANAPRGIVFWDEIENGVHHSILPKIWQAIERITKEFDTQFFATTHSLECIKAAHSVFSNHEPYDFAVYRLDRIGEAVRAVRYDKDLLEAAVETQMEIR